MRVLQLQEQFQPDQNETPIVMMGIDTNKFPGVQRVENKGLETRMAVDNAIDVEVKASDELANKFPDAITVQSDVITFSGNIAAPSYTLNEDLGVFEISNGTQGMYKFGNTYISFPATMNQIDFEKLANRVSDTKTEYTMTNGFDHSAKEGVIYMYNNEGQTITTPDGLGYFRNIVERLGNGMKIVETMDGNHYLLFPNGAFWTTPAAAA